MVTSQLQLRRRVCLAKVLRDEFMANLDDPYSWASNADMDRMHREAIVSLGSSPRQSKLKLP